MKAPTPAPIFACFYAGMCNVARANGYALALHGSLVRDMDVIACPWTDAACSAEELVKKLFAYLNATDLADQLRSVGLSEDAIEKHLDEVAGKCPEKKPHGRLAWNLYLHAGIKIDVSVMPRLEAKKKLYLVEWLPADTNQWEPWSDYDMDYHEESVAKELMKRTEREHPDFTFRVVPVEEGEVPSE